MRSRSIFRGHGDFDAAQPGRQLRQVAPSTTHRARRSSAASHSRARVRGGRAGRGSAGPHSAHPSPCWVVRCRAPARAHAGRRPVRPNGLSSPCSQRHALCVSRPPPSRVRLDAGAAARPPRHERRLALQRPLRVDAEGRAVVVDAPVVGRPRVRGERPKPRAAQPAADLVVVAIHGPLADRMRDRCHRGSRYGATIRPRIEASRRTGSRRARSAPGVCTGRWRRRCGAHGQHHPRRRSGAGGRVSHAQIRRSKAGPADAPHVAAEL
jgi:hypothetical protein